MAGTMAEKGYVATSVADVLRAAKVSRETFYEQFDSKEDCFMSALEAATGVVLAQAFATRPAGRTPPRRGLPPAPRRRDAPRALQPRAAHVPRRSRRAAGAGAHVPDRGLRR